MKRLVTWIVMIPFALVVIVFSASNRELVALNLWPFPIEITVPIFTLVLAVFIFGFLMGGIVMWASAGRTRQKARDASWRAANAERDLRSVSHKLDTAEQKLKATDVGDGAANLPAKT